METEQTPVETYAKGVLELLMAYGRKELNDDGLINAVVKLRNECLDAEKRAHQNWFNKGFEFYHGQLLTRQQTN
jgi:hypothetical protein